MEHGGACSWQAADDKGLLDAPIYPDKLAMLKVELDDLLSLPHGTGDHDSIEKTTHRRDVLIGQQWRHRTNPLLHSFEFFGSSEVAVDNIGFGPSIKLSQD